MARGFMAVVAVASALVLGAACEQNSSRNGAGMQGSRGGATSAPMSRSPSGDTGTRSGSNDTDRGSPAASRSSASDDLSGTGGSGDAGMGRPDAGMHR